MPRTPFSAKKRTAQSGSRAARIPGSSKMWKTPRAPSVRNQRRTMGPKAIPTFEVPRCWNAKSATRIATVMGMT